MFFYDRTRRMLWDQTLDWDYDVEESLSGDLVFVLERTEDRGYPGNVRSDDRTQVEVDRFPAPSAGNTATATVDPIGLELARDTRYEMAVKHDDGTAERTLWQGLLFILRPRVNTNDP